MKKRLILSLSLVVMAMAMYAIPAKRGLWRTIQLTDGTSVRAMLVGDEHAHFYRDVQGNCYRNNGTAFVKADRKELVRKAQMRRMKGAAQKRRLAAAPGMKKVGGATGNNYTGKKKGLIILVEFLDKKFEEGHDAALYNRIVNEPGFTSEEGFKGSVHDYFSAQSGGQFDLTFDVMGPVPLKNNTRYYGRNNTNDEDTNAEAMISEACQAIDSDVNFADYDWDGDGEVDQVYVLYAGLSEAAGGSEDTVWPHEYWLSAKGSALTLDGVKVDTYACSSELTGIVFDDWTGEATEWGIDGIGSFCHEFSHCLGLPDMYDTTYQNFGMGTWDLMDHGTYNGDERGFVPAGYSSYEKWCAGWLEPIELKEDTQVTSMKPLSEGGEAYVIYNDAHPDEYYLLENRQLTGWDAGQYGKGMLILHVDYDEEMWAWNMVNSIDDLSGAPYFGPKNDHQRLTIIPADNSLAMDKIEYNGEVYYQIDYTSLPGDPYPYRGNNSLTNTSKPKASLYNKNTDGKKLMNKEVTDITQNADGTMSFNFKVVESGSEGGEQTAAGTVFHETFDQCNGKGGNDGQWMGAIANAAFVPDVEGWETGSATNISFGADQCAKFGTASTMGVVMTPTFNLQGEATLTLRVAPWGNGRENQLQIYYAGEDATSLDDLEIIYSGDMTPGEWNELTLTLKGDGDNYMIFQPQKRFFIDDVLITVPETTDIREVSPKVRPVGGRIYTIDGRFVGLDFNALKPGIYVVDGKKVVK